MSRPAPGKVRRAAIDVERRPRSGAPSLRADGHWTPTFGAIPEPDGTTFRVWASAARSVRVLLEQPDGRPAGETRMAPRDGELFEARIEGARPGTLYRYVLDGHDPYPDPASRFQPRGVHGPSQVVDWTRYHWTDDRWRGVRFEDLLIYELHVGTFTAQGTFTGLIDRLAYLADLGVTAIELMPLAAFPGRRNWGYDGVALFAPACAYGRPEDLQHLVNSAHLAGLAVIVDVVYNHLGPDGAYLSAFSPDFFSPHHTSPWGSGVNLDGPGSVMVRRFLIENALHWILEYHVDGLRLDATHVLEDDSDRHLLAELADAVHGLDVGRPLHVIAEDERNVATLVRRPAAGGMGLDGVWADDFHHEIHRLLTGEGGGYYADYTGRVQDLAVTINQGWFYTGQRSMYSGRPRGSDASDVDRQRFVVCLQNHDQAGNRAFGERLCQLADLPSCRTAAAVLLLTPETPLLFMGEEWAASTPFLYFTDHGEELGRLVTEGRRREFARFPAFSSPGARSRIPDPQDAQTFAASRLKWEETASEPHASMLRLYRSLIALRDGDPRLADGPRARPAAGYAIDSNTLAVIRPGGDGDLLLVARFGAGGHVLIARAPRSRDQESGLADALGDRLAGPWNVVLTTEDPEFAPDAARPRFTSTNSALGIEFTRPSAIVLRRRS